MADAEQAFRFKPNYRNTAVPLDGKQAPAKLILYIRIFPDAYGKNQFRCQIDGGKCTNPQYP